MGVSHGELDTGNLGRFKEDIFNCIYNTPDANFNYSCVAESKHEIYSSFKIKEDDNINDAITDAVNMAIAKYGGLSVTRTDYGTGSVAVEGHKTYSKKTHKVVCNDLTKESRRRRLAYGRRDRLARAEAS